MGVQWDKYHIGLSLVNQILRSMDKKRERDLSSTSEALDVEDHPSSKTPRLSSDSNDDQPPIGHPAQTPEAAAACADSDPPSVDPSFPQDPEDDSLVRYQRAQLAARITEQTRDILWLRDKVNELQKLVAVLDAAPRAALYHMCAVREDLTLTLARLGLAPDTDDAFNCPIAATLLDAEIVTNDSLAEMPAALKKLTAQIILAMEKNEHVVPCDPVDKIAHDELHRRIREVSDQLERYAERDKQSLVSSTTFRDEYDDLREEASIQRRKIVSLEEKLKEQHEKLAIIPRTEEEHGRDDAKSSVKGEIGPKRSMDSLGHPGTAQNGPSAVGDSLKELAGKRLQELYQAHDENKRLISDIEGLRAEVARRDSNVVPIKTIINSALYQTMEATLQQLYLKEKNWQVERDARNEEFEAERKDAAERLEQANTASEKKIEDLHRQLDEMRRIADAAKVEKDKVVMTYEARKMETGNAAAILAAAEKRADTCDEMRGKLMKENKLLSTELESLRKYVGDLETQMKDSSTVCFSFSFFALSLRRYDEFRQLDSFTTVSQWLRGYTRYCVECDVPIDCASCTKLDVTREVGKER